MRKNETLARVAAHVDLTKVSQTELETGGPDKLNQIVDREEGVEQHLAELAAEESRKRPVEQLNDISEEDRAHELDDEVEHDGDEVTDCARNEYELNMNQQNLNQRISNTKKVVQVKNKVTDQRTTMDTNANSNRK